MDATPVSTRLINNFGQPFSETVFALPDVSPQQVDTVIVELSIDAAPATPVIGLDWDTPTRKGGRSFCMQQGIRSQYCFFHVCECRHWVFAGPVSKLKVMLPGDCPPSAIKSVTLLSGNTHVAKFSARSGQLRTNRDSTVNFVGQGADFDYDVSEIANAKRAFLEVSKTNYCFEHFARTFHDPGLGVNPEKRIELASLKGTINIKRSDLPAGPCQIRAIAVDQNGSVVGTSSYPVTVR